MEVVEEKKKVNRDPKVRQVKSRITTMRKEIAEEKSSVPKLGDRTSAVQPENIAVMYAAKMCVLLMKQKVSSGNIQMAYKREYDGIITPEIEAQIVEMQTDFEAAFEVVKKKAEKLVSKHPLWQRFSGIKGLSAYRLGIIMSYIKDISRFDTPSKLCVYAGVTDKNGVAMRKAALPEIKEMYLEEGKEFAGFNTDFSQQMHIISESFIKADGYFKGLFDRMRKRLEERAMNGGECFQLTEELKKKYKTAQPDGTEVSSATAEVGAYYMYKKKNYSLKMWSMNNANRRIRRTLLHLIWTEWRTLAGLPLRTPYPIEYQGHTTYITLDEILKAELEIGARKKIERTNKKKIEEEEGE